MNRGRRQVTLTRESRGETACSLGPAMAIYTNCYSFDGLFVVESNHNHHLLKSLDSLVCAALQRPPSIKRSPSFFVLAGADIPHCVSTACFCPLCRPKIGLLLNRLGKSTVQPSTDAPCFPAFGAVNFVILTIFLLLSTVHVSRQSTLKRCSRSMLSTGLMAETRIRQHHLLPRAPASSRPTFMPQA
jgi:hypothetical protein